MHASHSVGKEDADRLAVLPVTAQLTSESLQLVREKDRNLESGDVLPKESSSLGNLTNVSLGKGSDSAFFPPKVRP